MREEDLDFSVDIPPGRRRKRRAASAVRVLALGGVFFLAALCGAVGGRAAAGGGEAGRCGGMLPPEEERAYARSLEEQGLHALAADAWKNYLETVPREKRAAVLFRMGENLMKAGKYAGALDAFYRAERVGGRGSVDVAENVRVCLEAMGACTALRKEEERRTAVGPPGRDDPVLAEVGGRTIRKSDVAAALEGRVTMQMSALGGKILPAEYTRRKEKLLDSYLDDPRLFEAVVEEIVRRELLFLASKAAGVKETPEETARIREMRKMLRGERFLRDRVTASLDITDADVRTYFRANRDDYREPARARIRVASVSDGKEAARVLKECRKRPGLFARYAEKEPLNGKLADLWLREGGRIPGLEPGGAVRDIFSPGRKKGDILGPVQVKDRWFLVRIEDFRPARIPTFDEVKERVAGDYYLRKYAETERRILDELREKYDVKVYRNRFGTSHDTAR